MVVFSGSGLSTASGIPAFRGEGGLWEKYDPNMYVTADGVLTRLVRHPEDLRNFILEFYSLLLKAEPNPAHQVIADWEAKGYVCGVITQNIDGLRSGRIAQYMRGPW